MTTHTNDVAALPEALTEYLEAQDALDNREYAGINAEPYEKLVRSRNHARAVLESALAAGQVTAAPAIGDELRDTLVAVSAAIAERDDRAAQKMIGEILAASPTPPAEQQPATEVALVGAYARLPDFDSGDEPIWEAVFDWKTAIPGSDAMKKAMAVESTIIDSLRDFADRTHALRMEQVAKAAPGEPSAHQILAITTAYEQGVGKGHQAYKSGKGITNPYDSAYGCDLAWQYGYREGKEQAQRATKAALPAEQQATKETSGGFHVWRDISTAPKDGSRFVATGHNYGLYSEVRHTCVAQWFQGCWMEASDWNETSELKYLTHWMPLPPLPGNAARKQGGA